MSWKKEWPHKPDYEVGYGKTPKSTRFKPGQSGNKTGRPRQSKNAKSLLQDVLNEKVVVTKGGIQQRMTKLEAFIENLVARSMKEDRYANLLMKLLLQHDLMKADETGGEMRIVLVSPKGIGKKD